MNQPRHEPSKPRAKRGRPVPTPIEPDPSPARDAAPSIVAETPSSSAHEGSFPFWGVALVAAWVASIVLFGLSRFGIWDPWELTAADAARGLPGGEELAARTPPLPRALVGLGFELFGVREWAGRLPIALVGLLALGAGYFLVSRFAGRRAGAFTVLVAGTSPLFLFNARQMIGDAPAFAADALVGLSALAAVYLPTRAGVEKGRANSATVAWLALLIGSLTFAFFARGMLLGGLPALLAVALTALLRGEVAPSAPGRRRAWAAAAVVALAAMALVAVVSSVAADAAQYDGWLGGMPRGGEPPTFEAALERIFHAFAPWSALLLLACGRLLVGSAESSAPRTDPQSAFRIALLLWAALAYGALTLFGSRYGAATYPALIPLAAAVALLIVDVERGNAPLLPGAIVAGLFVLLLLRDFSLYPASPLAALSVEGLELPADFNPKRAWRAWLGGFAVLVVLGFAAGPSRAAGIDLRAPYRGLGASWRKDRATRAWLVSAGLLVAALLVFGAVSWIFGTRAGLTSIAVRAGRRIALIVPLVPVGIALAQLVFAGFARLGARRLVPLLVVGALMGGYAAQILTPAASAQFSPRTVYDLFARHAKKGERLAEYRTGSRAAAYYADRPIESLKGPGAVTTFLGTDERGWLLLPADELPAVNKAYREKARRHLFVLGESGSRIVLATNQDLPNEKNQNPLAEAVRTEVPAVQHRVGARFENKVELVGYDLELPERGFAGAGQTFTITWVFRVIERLPGNLKPFVHVDRGSQRINGDHDPVDGKYPIRLWSPSDVIVDRQSIAIPANMRPGTYEIFTGFFSGETRLKVTAGPNDGNDRVRAGTIEVR